MGEAEAALSPELSNFFLFLRKGKKKIKISCSETLYLKLSILQHKSNPAGVMRRVMKLPWLSFPIFPMFLAAEIAVLSSAEYPLFDGN